ncbi:MAG: hypothetical protein IT328_23465 [Caldilineaceae bacterium]|nr:hypothetical protein [Caldilineaceae bacterium]
MGDVESPKSTSGGWLQRLLASSSLAWIVQLIELVNALYRFGVSSHHTGMYEILEYDNTLELLDPHGKNALFHKHQRVKFLQDNIIAFQDYAWGEGTNIFATYSCKPGVVVDRYQEGDRWNILISLRGTKHRGEIEDFYIERKTINGFIKNEEWSQVEIRNPTQRLRMSIIFPKMRHCQRAQLVQRSRQRTKELGLEHLHDLADGRQILQWQATSIRQLEVYTIKWWW